MVPALGVPDKDDAMMLRSPALGLALMLAASPVLAQDLTISLGNNSWDSLAGLAVSPAGQNAYVEMELTDGALRAGNFMALVLKDGASVCVYDLRFKREDGTVIERPGVDLCAQSYYHFADE